jgi:zinc transport system substrate-binding protein
VVAVSVVPQRYVVERIAGDLVEVVVMIPPGASPTSFAPGLGQVRALHDAVLYVKVGHPAFAFEAAWLDALLEDASELSVVSPAPGEGPDAADPHVWLAPSSVRSLARRVEAALAERLPEHRATLAGNRRRFEAEIDGLDAELRQLFGPLRGRRFLVLHPAWGHFAREYGLVQIAIEKDGKEPDPARLARLVADAREAGIGTLFVQPQIDDAPARVVAGEIGARVVTLDPLAYDWPENLRNAAARIAEAAVE